jgi:molybdate transport system regulatory protein
VAVSQEADADKTRRKAMPKLTLRIDFDADRAIGPGKVKLLEMIDKHGSISEAGRQMGMSYRRAWLLVDSLNRSFNVPVIASQKGGQHGGGAVLTEFGHTVVQHYRAIESAAENAGAAHIDALATALAKRGRPARKLTGEKTRRLARNLG